MGKFTLIILLGFGLFVALAMHFNWIQSPEKGGITQKRPQAVIPSLIELGEPLYSPQPFPEEKLVESSSLRADPVRVAAYFNVMDKGDVPSQMDGQILFIGEAIPEGAAQVAGLAPFMTEQFHYATVKESNRDYAILYRRLHQDAVVSDGQVLAMLDPARILGEVAKQKAKVKAAQAESRATDATWKEAKARAERARSLYARGAIALEDLTAAELSEKKFYEDSITKKEGVKLAQIEVEQAELMLKYHEIRNKIGVKHSIVKMVYRNRMESVKNLEPVLHLYSLDRLWAEALVEVSHPLLEGMKVTLEPMQEESPLKTFKGHKDEITSVAVTNDPANPLVVSASEDRTVAIWKRTMTGPLAVLDHPDRVRVVAASPPEAKQSWIITGCDDGTIRLYDLENPAEPKQIGEAVKAHSDAVTALAIGPEVEGEGIYFATGGAESAIKLWLWKGSDIKLAYPFDAKNGVKNAHTDRITALQFTPQCQLVSASKDNTLRIWTLRKKGAALVGEPIANRSGNVGQLGVSQDGRWLLFDQAKELQLLSGKDGRTLTTLKNPAGAIPFETLALFSPDNGLLLTAGAPEGRLQLWSTPTPGSRGFEVRQFVNDERAPVTCAAFAPRANPQGSFAVSGTKDGYVYLWAVPSQGEVDNHCIGNLRLTRIARAVESSNRQLQIGVEVTNTFNERFPKGRLKPGRPVTVVIEP